jgi:hypothetical protein
MRIFFVISLILFSSSTVYCQRLLQLKCTNQITINNYLKANELDMVLSNNTNSQKNKRGLKYIPVVFHILWYTNEENIPDEKIYEQLEELNNCFNAINKDILNIPDEFKNSIGNSGIKFCLANKDEFGVATNGIIRKQISIKELGIKDTSVFYSNLGGDDAWDTERYLNIWVVNTGRFIGGYGIYPWASTKAKNGVVVHPKYIGINSSNYMYGRLLVHEMGHYFGLYHTWMDDNNCNTDDGIVDTPNQNNPYYGNPAYPQTTCNTSNNFMNFMDYVNDNSMYMFTKEQCEKMNNVIDMYKPNLTKSNKSFCSYFNIDNIDFEISPNPFYNSITIKIPNSDFGNYIVTIYDITGKIEMKVGNPLNNLINLSNLASGMYFLSIGANTKKIIKY